MNDNDFLERLAAISKNDPASISDGTAIEPDTWDSVEVLDLIAAIDEAYGVTVPTADLNKCRTVGELRSLIRAAAGTQA